MLGMVKKAEADTSSKSLCRFWKEVKCKISKWIVVQINSFYSCFCVPGFQHSYYIKCVLNKTVCLTLSLMTVTVASATFMVTGIQSSLLEEAIRLSMALFRVSIPKGEENTKKKNKYVSISKQIFYFHMVVRKPK